MVKYMFDKEKGEDMSEKMEPILIEKAVGFFLENGMMGGIVQGHDVIKDCRVGSNLRVDFVAGDTCIETKVFTMKGRCTGMGMKSVLHSLALNKGNLKALQERYGRVILLAVCQEDMCRQMDVPSLYKGLREIIGEGIGHGIEIWISEIRTEPDGITLLSCKNAVAIND